MGGFNLNNPPVNDEVCFSSEDENYELEGKKESIDEDEEESSDDGIEQLLCDQEDGGCGGDKASLFEQTIIGAFAGNCMLKSLWRRNL